MSKPTNARESLFPSTSIGRTQGLNIRSASSSHEPLAAHPLLSPTPQSTSAVASEVPKYVPYTPRQRAVHSTSTTTTSTIVGSGAGVSHDATSKLQLQALKAAAQGIGIDVGSTGWYMLERIVVESEWGDVLAAITTGKATLMLPLEALGNDKDLITADLVRDHVVLADGPLKNGSPVVTLSGLRGVFESDSLTIRGSLHTSAGPYRTIFNPATRQTGLSALPPLPPLPSSDAPIPSSPHPSPTPTQAKFGATIHGSPYPKYRLPTYTSALPLPPRSSSSTTGSTGKLPALSPRPPQGRLSNPFAALFGGKAAVSTPTPSLAAKSPNHSPTPSITSITTEAQDHVWEISVYAIDKRIIRRDVAREINKALKTEITTKLRQGLAPHWAVDRVLDFVEMLHPLVRKSRKGKGVASSTAWQPNSFGLEAADGTGVPVGESTEEVAEQLQDLYASLEQDLRSGSGGAKLRREPSQANPRDREEQRSDLRVREIMEVVEATICDLFYDKLFRQTSTDDASHDEALSSRVAALNMLDLGLEHLDVKVGNSQAELDVVVRACGETLSQLQVCRTPADKAAILVAAHRVVVDGLGKLPPIRLKSEEDEKVPLTPKLDQASTISRKEVVVEEPPQPQTPLEILPEDIPIPESPASNSPCQASDSMTTVILSQPSIPALNLPEPEEASLPGSAPPSPSLLTSTRSTSPAGSPRLMLSPPPEETTPVSGDILLPLIIFSVVKSNPSCLVSHILFIQRFRNQSVGGEESYCLINLMAVAEFLENVDLAALGLGESENRVMSAADLTPIPINRVNTDSPRLADGTPGSLRGRVEQQVDAITGSANRVIGGVVDTSFGVLRSLLPSASADTRSITSSVQNAAPWNVRPGFLTRRESGFSIAGIAASLPGRDRSRSQAGEEGRPLVEVNSRPGSVRSVYGGDSEDDTGISAESGEDVSGEGEDDDEEYSEEEGAAGDTRSIRSFENMMARKGSRKGVAGRKSLTDRLATMSGLARLGSSDSPKVSPPPSRRASLVPPILGGTRFDSPVSSRPTSPTPSVLRLAPPNPRFVECEAGDLRLSEIGELLREYRRLVQGVRAAGGFDE